MNELLEEYGYNYRIFHTFDGIALPIIEFYNLDGTSFTYFEGELHE